MKLRMFFIGALLLVLQACSNYTGHKLPLDGTITKDTGVPYTLTKPSFTVEQKSEGKGKPPTFEIKVAYVPDPMHRYTLRVDPSWFTDLDFAVTFGNHNELKKTSNTQTDQLVPAIKSLGIFAAQVVGALGVFDKGDIRTEITRKVSTIAECDAVKDKLNRRINGFKNEKTFRDRFHYLDNDERTCLSKVVENLKLSGQKTLADRKEEVEKRILNFSKNNTTTEDKLFVQFANQRLAENDKVALESLKAKLAPIITSGSRDMMPVRRFLKLKPGSALTLVKLTNWSSVNSVVLGYVIEALSDGGSKFLKTVVEMPFPVWRMRHVQYLERCIQEYHFNKLRGQASPKGCEKDRDVLFLQLAETIDAVELKGRMETLQGFLSSIPEGCVVVGNVPCNRKLVSDYKLARQELSQVMSDFQAVRSKVITDGTPMKKEPPKPKKKQPIIALTKEEFEKLPGSEEKPEWVIVFRRPQ